MSRESYSYSISPASRSRTDFVLREGPRILGELKVSRRHGGEAVIVVDGAELNAFRTALLKKNLALHRRSDSAALCFTADLLSRGKMEAAGREYCWEPANLNWTAWAWRGPHGRDLLRVSFKHGLRGARGVVFSAAPLVEPWQKEMAMLGWYLLLLNQSDFGAHLLSALKVAAAGI